MVRVPIVNFYNLDKTLINIANFGSMGTFVYKFTYTYGEAGPDTAKITLAFPTPSVDLTFMQTGLGYMINWGYIEGPMSELRTVVVEEASYKYSSAGFIVELKMVPFAEKTLEGVIRDPKGAFLEDAVATIAENAPQGIEVKVPRIDGWVYQGIKKPDTEWKFDYLKDGKSGQEMMAERIASDIKKHQAEKALAEAEAEARALVQDDMWEGQYGLYSRRTRARAGTLPEPPDELMDSDRKLIMMYSYLLRKTGDTRILQIRDGIVQLAEPAWSEPATFAITRLDNLISFNLTKGDKEGRLVESVTTTADPTTGEVITGQTVIGNALTLSFYGEFDNPDTPQDETQEIVGKLGLVEQDGNFYVTDDNMTVAFPISREQFEYREEAGKRQAHVKEWAAGSVPGKEHREITIPEDQQELAAKNAEAWMFSQEIHTEGIAKRHLSSPHLTILYNGRNYSEAKSAAIRDEMDKVFYNGKLTIKIEGNPAIEDKVNMEFAVGNTLLDGTYHIDESEHSITKNGYITTIVAYKVISNYKRIENTASKQFGEEWDAIEAKLTTKTKGVNYISAQNAQQEYWKQTGNDTIAMTSAIYDPDAPLQLLDMKKLNLLNLEKVNDYEEYTKAMDELTIIRAVEKAQRESDSIANPEKYAPGP